MNKLVIISGITGAIGSACLTEFAQDENITVYGLSRKALSYKRYIRENNVFPEKTFISSVGTDIANVSTINDFTMHIPWETFDETVYIHAVGYYPFEINAEGELTIENDTDQDGINDLVKRLTYDAFSMMIDSLVQVSPIPLRAVIFGSLADKHRPQIHTSWWKTIELIKEYSKSTCREHNDLSIKILNISSVLCPHEILTRPNVCIDTNAKLHYWLKPEEVARKVASDERLTGYVEEDFFHISPDFEEDYYDESKFTPRKMRELGYNL